MRFGSYWWLAACVLLAGVDGIAVQGKTFRVATYNLEGYVEDSTPGRTAKSPESKAKVRENIRLINPDVIALQEMGGTNALLELRDSLKAEGLDFPYWEYVTGFDTNIHVAVLSRLPLTARNPHTTEGFLLNGRRFRVSRGFAEVQVQVTSNYVFSLFAAHLKSKRQVPAADEAEIRLEEAKVLRRLVELRLEAEPGARLVVLGDLNDTKDSASTRMLIGRGKTKLVDTRPAERNGDGQESRKGHEPRTITWTHYYGKEDSYARIDYVLLSAGMARTWLTNQSYVLSVPNWGLASDHRPVVAAFEIEDQGN